MYFSSSYPLIGGREFYCMLLAKHLSAQGLNVKIHADTVAPLDAAPMISDCVEVKNFQVAKRKRRFLGYLNSIRCCSKSFFGLSRSLKEADVLHVHAPSNYFSVPLLGYQLREWVAANNLARKPVVVTVHGTPIEGFCETKAYLTEVQHADHIIVLSKVAQTYFLGKGIKADSLSVIPSAVDLQIFNSNDYCSFQQSSDPLNILFPARIDPQKGLLDLVKAVKNLVDQGMKIQVRIVGGTLDLDYELEVKRYIHEHSLCNSFVFVGEKSYFEMPEEYAACDLMVLPSYFEGFPLSILEAMAMKKPVISTSVGGITELIANHVNGLLCTPGDIDELSQAVSELYYSPERRARMGLAGHDIVSKSYNWTVISQQIADVYRSLN